MITFTLPFISIKKISRKDAKAKGLRMFYTGKPCKDGHICERYVVNWVCFLCHKPKCKKYDKDNYKHLHELRMKGRKRKAKQKANKKKAMKFLPDVVLDKSKKEWKFVPYDSCCIIARNAGVTSHHQYKRWITLFKPSGMPYSPETTYPEWESWPIFLNTNNMLRTLEPGSVLEHDLMDYWEAVGIISQMGITSEKQYREIHSKGDVIPAGIPIIPHQRYPDFTKNGGWPLWLGKSVQHKLTAQKNMPRMFMLYNTPDRPANILSVLIHRTGTAALRKLVTENNISVVKIFHWYDNFSEHIFQLLDKHGSKQDDISWLFSNVHEILSEISEYLEVWKPR